ncbi:MAG: biopolymer transporter ExbD [Planctomycetia bacterium]|nr:biopolymer transporter ExbD [Planctomycetia bacterium]
MKSPQHLKPKSFAMNMTPMIDVVFLLIIFFIISSSMIKQEAAMKLDLPVAATGEQATAEATSAKVVINIDASGQTFLGTRPLAIDDLRQELIRQRQESSLPLAIRIRTSREVPYAQIEPVLVACTQAGVGDVSFAVYDE